MFLKDFGFRPTMVMAMFTSLANNIAFRRLIKRDHISLNWALRDKSPSIPK